MTVTWNMPLRAAVPSVNSCYGLCLWKMRKEWLRLRQRKLNLRQLLRANCRTILSSGHPGYVPERSLKCTGCLKANGVGDFRHRCVAFLDDCGCPPNALIPYPVRQRNAGSLRKQMRKAAGGQPDAAGNLRNMQRLVQIFHDVGPHLAERFVVAECKFESSVRSAGASPRSNWRVRHSDSRKITGCH